ncbi:21782_t:CDS:2, partial [Rhizophagus irregularis]
ENVSARPETLLHADRNTLHEESPTIYLSNRNEIVRDLIYEHFTSSSCAIVYIVGKILMWIVCWSALMNIIQNSVSFGRLYGILICQKIEIIRDNTKGKPSDRSPELVSVNLQEQVKNWFIDYQDPEKEEAYEGSK